MSYIHREGNSMLLIAFLLFAGINLILNIFLSPQHWFVLIIEVISLIIFLVLLNFFRNPSRNISVNENHIIAPADGKVVVIEEVEETEFLKDKRIQVSIFMSPLNVHVNRYPVSGKVKYTKYHPGLFLVAWHPKSSTENERTTVVVESKIFGAVLFRQIAGALAKRIVCYARDNDNAQQGEEFGFIKFGSRVDTFLPLGTKINVQLNQKVIGGETVIAAV